MGICRYTPYPEGVFVASSSEPPRRFQPPAPPPRAMARPCALITGSVSGIGLHIAEAFAAAQHDVVLHSVRANEEAGREIAARLARDCGVRAAFLAADLCDAEELSGLVPSAKRLLGVGGFDVLVNNAGLQHVSRAEDFPLDAWDRVLQVNLTAPFVTTRSCLPDMYERGFGRIINIASAHALVASPLKSAYCAAKHGLAGFVKSVALEAAQRRPRVDVTVNAIAPGYVRTPLVEGQLEATARERGMSKEDVIEEVILAAHPSGAFVPGEEVAALALHMAGRASAMQGAVVPIDQAWTAR